MNTIPQGKTLGAGRPRPGSFTPRPSASCCCEWEIWMVNGEYIERRRTMHNSSCSKHDVYPDGRFTLTRL